MRRYKVTPVNVHDSKALAEVLDPDRIEAAILLASGWSAQDIADALPIDANTVRNQFKRYQQGGIWLACRTWPTAAATAR